MCVGEQSWDGGSTADRAAGRAVRRPAPPVRVSRLSDGPARAGRRSVRGPYLTAVSSGVISSIAYGIDRTVLKENAAPMSGSW